jgi:hypothetical protein
MNLKKVDIKDIRNIVCDRLEIETTNISLCARMGRGVIKVFNSFLRRAYNDEPLYAFVPKEATRHGVGDWEYDISSFKIYKISKKYLNSEGFTDSDINITDSKAMLTIRLDDECIVYDSSAGVKVEITGDEKTEFTLKEKACLFLNLPESGTKWLDELIIKKNKNVLLNLNI